VVMTEVAQSGTATDAAAMNAPEAKVPLTASVVASTAASPAAAAADPVAAPAVSSDAPASAPPPKAAAGDKVEGGKKRPAQNPQEGKADAKRRRADFAVGDRGVFFTCAAPGGSGSARRDLVRLLEIVLAQEASTASKATGADGTPAAAPAATVGSALDAELQELKTTKPSFVFCSHEVAKGTGFLKFAEEAAKYLPSTVVVRVLEAQKAEFLATSMAPSSRLLCRVLPIDNTCKPFLEDFKKLAQAVLPQHVGPEAEPTVWALEFRARNTTTLKKEAVLAIIDEIVPMGRHKVNLSDPAKCILVEVNPLFCGLSILSHWASLKKYNLHALTTPEELRKPPAGASRAPAMAAKVSSNPAEETAQAGVAAPALDTAVPPTAATVTSVCSTTATTAAPAEVLNVTAPPSAATAASPNQNDKAVDTPPGNNSTTLPSSDIAAASK